MPSAELPEQVRWLIVGHVASALELDVLLAMRERREPVSADDLARELRSNAAVTAAALDKFTAAGFVASEEAGYAFRPESPRLAGAVDALAECYARRRVRVIEFIYKRPSEGVSAFADAFRLRKDR